MFPIIADLYDQLSRMAISSDGNNKDSEKEEFNHNMLTHSQYYNEHNNGYRIPSNTIPPFVVVMIENVTNNPKINKRRVINIYETDYNLILKFI